MTFYKCDRCGKEITDGEKCTVAIFGCKEDPEDIWEGLCVDCAKIVAKVIMHQKE